MEDFSLTHPTQTILSSGRPDTWFIDTHPTGAPSSPVTTPQRFRGTSKQQTKDDVDHTDVQIAPHPWTYPEHHQEIVGRPTGWLGGGYSNNMSPVRRNKRATATTFPSPEGYSGPSTPSRSRPEPIQIDGVTSSLVKNSPFLR